MALEQYAVQLTPDEREQLSRLLRSGKSSARIVARARILLKVAEGWNAPQVAAALDVSKGTVYRAKRRYAEEGLDGVLQDRVQANRYRKLDDRGEAHLIALACSPAPAGHDHWTLQLLADRVVELGLVESLSHETVRLRLKKTSPSRGGSSSGASPRQGVNSWRRCSWRRWRTCWTCMLSPTTRTGQWSALMRLPPSCWPTPSRPSQCNRDHRGVRITNIAAAAPATSS